MFYVTIVGSSDILCTYGPMPDRAEAERWVKANPETCIGNRVFIHAWKPFKVDHELKFLRDQGVA